MTDVPHDQRCDGEVDVPYEFEVPGMVATGYKCRVCNFRTFTVETYTPAEKPCSRCGRRFLGQPDVHTEKCDDCFDVALTAWMEQARTCDHEPVDGLCRKCGTGPH